MRFQKAGRGVADQGGVPEPHCSLHAQGLKLSCQTQGPELSRPRSELSRSRPELSRSKAEAVQNYQTTKHTSVTI